MTDHAQALERFKLGTDAISQQVKREKDDLQFQVPEPEFQWSDDARTMRAGSTVGNIAVPAKPMLCIPKLDQPIQLVLNQEKAAHLGVQVHALSEDADDDTAEVLQGLYRRIEVDSRAGLARSWAYERAVKCGRGAYRILTEYTDEGGDPRDQKIVIKRLLHQEAVVFDPFAEEPDWSDGRWAFITSWMPWDRYKAKYPKSTLAACEDDDLSDTFVDCPNWIMGEGEGRAVLIAEYFRLDLVSREADAVGPDQFTLKWSLINAIEELDSEDMDGRYIPIIPVIGQEMIPFDSERRWSGIITKNKDAQRVFNYSASQAVLRASLEPLQSTVVDPRQIEGYETFWQNRNTKQLPYLPMMMDSNKGWGPPTLLQTDNSQISTSIMLMQQSDNFIHSGTGAFEASLGQGSPQNKTKGGILALQQQQEQGNSHFLDNLAEISLTYEAKVILDKMPYVYDRPGRVVRTLDLEDNTKTVMLNQPFVKGPNGRPQAAPPPMPGAPQQGMVPNPNAPQQAPQGPKVLHFDLKKGRYGVIVSVGKSYQNRAQQGKDELGQIFQAVPETFQLLADLYFKFADFPGHREAAERMKKMLPPQLQDQDEQDIAAKAHQLAQENAALKQHLQQIGGELAKDKLKADAQIQIAQGKEQTQRMKISAASSDADKNRAKDLYVAELEAKTQRLQLLNDGLQAAAGMTHDEGLAGAQAAHELQMQQQAHQQQMAQAQAGAQNQAALAEQGQQHALEQGAQGQQNTLEQQQQQADLAPDPAAGA